MPRHPADYVPAQFGEVVLDESLPTVPQLYAIVRQKILLMELKPGDQISEAVLAEVAGVSRTPARQVVKQLISENLLNSFPSRGTFVSSINPVRLNEALVIRRQLEPYMAQQCALGDDVQDSVDRLNANLAEHEAALKAPIAEGSNDIDEAFHEIICSHGGKTLIWDTVRRARAESDRLHAISKQNHDSLVAALDQHREIVCAISDGNAELSYKTMDDHMKFNETLFGSLIKQSPELFES